MPTWVKEAQIRETQRIVGNGVKLKWLMWPGPNHTRKIQFKRTPPPPLPRPDTHTYTHTPAAPVHWEQEGDTAEEERRVCILVERKKRQGFGVK